VTDNDGWTPLHGAAEGGEGESFVRIVKMLLDHGADVNAASHIGNTPLMRAVKFENNLPIVTLLLEHGADVKKQESSDSFGYTALHESVIHGNAEIVKALLDHGADVNAKIIGSLDNGQTALHRAVAYPWENIVKLLLAYDADTGIKDAKGETALDVALAWAKVKGQDEEFSRVIALLEQHMKNNLNSKS
jgi:ankyrin repeat protein